MNTGQPKARLRTPTATSTTIFTVGPAILDAFLSSRSGRPSGETLGSSVAADGRFFRYYESPWRSLLPPMVFLGALAFRRARQM